MAHSLPRAKTTPLSFSDGVLRLGAALTLTLSFLYFVLPLVATFEFSLRLRREAYGFEAYRIILGDTAFQASFVYSMTLALATIVIGTALCLPTAAFIQLRFPRLRGLVEFLTLLPLVIPAIVLVFGYIRMFDSSSPLPLTASGFGTDILLTFAYVALALPYMYRAIDTGLRAIDIRTLSEAAQSLGANWPAILWHVLLPNIRSAVMGGAFLTIAIVMGEFTIAALLNRPSFGPYLQLLGAKRAYEPAALSFLSFLLTWGCMGLLQRFGSGARRAQRKDQT